MVVVDRAPSLPSSIIDCCNYGNVDGNCIVWFFQVGWGYGGGGGGGGVGGVEFWGERKCERENKRMMKPWTILVVDYGH